MCRTNGPRRHGAQAIGQECRGAKVGLMAEGRESFEDIVEWAYSTLPQKIRDLPDFPGIQVTDEPPEDMLKDTLRRKNWPQGTELFGMRLPTGSAMTLRSR